MDNNSKQGIEVMTMMSRKNIEPQLLRESINNKTYDKHSRRKQKFSNKKLRSLILALMAGIALGSVAKGWTDNLIFKEAHANDEKEKKDSINTVNNYWANLKITEKTDEGMHYPNPDNYEINEEYMASLCVKDGYVDLGNIYALLNPEETKNCSYQVSNIHSDYKFEQKTGDYIKNRGDEYQAKIIRIVLEKLGYEQPPEYNLADLLSGKNGNILEVLTNSGNNDLINKLAGLLGYSNVEEMEQETFNSAALKSSGISVVVPIDKVTAKGRGGH